MRTAVASGIFQLVAFIGRKNTLCGKTIQATSIVIITASLDGNIGVEPRPGLGLRVAAGALAEAAQLSDAFDDFFGGGVGGGVERPAAVAREVE